jgi:ribosomal-protein-alanine N-acetyltransferase
MAVEDLDDVVRIEADSFTTPWSRETFERLLDEDRVVVLVAVPAAEAAPRIGVVDERTHRPQVLGYAVLWWVVDQGELANLAVDPACRGRGLGAALLDRALGRAGSAGVTEVFLEVRRSNEAARALYESRGFRTVGFRRGYYSRPREDARIMMKRIDRD